MALDGMYERMVWIWSVVGGDSMTSRLYSRGGESLVGKGPDTAARSMFRALVDGGDDGWWLNETRWPERGTLLC